MELSEFSNGFDTLISSYRRFKDFDNKEILDSIDFNEYEKSLFLTLALEEIAVNLYNGKNYYGESFEATEELRRELNSLVKTGIWKEDSEDSQIPENTQKLQKVEGVGVSNNSIFFELPDDLMFITYELVTFNDESLGCYDKSTIDVHPVTLDEYNRISKNPFRGATKYRALRVDTGDAKVELISKYNIGKYLIKYLSKPTPIILEDLGDLTIEGISTATPCTLNKVLHFPILKRAVQLALASKTIYKEKGE